VSPRLYARAGRSRTVAAMGLTRATFKRPVVVDTAVAALVAVPTTLDAWWNVPGTRQVDELTYSLASSRSPALLVRRRWPVAVAGICGAALTGWFVLGHHGELLNLPTIVALYTVQRRAIAGAACSWAPQRCCGRLHSSLALIHPLRRLPATSATRSPKPCGPSWVALLLGETVRNRRELLAEYAACDARRGGPRA